MKSCINAIQIEKCVIEPQCEFVAGALVERLLVDCLSVVTGILIPYVRALFCPALVSIHVVEEFFRGFWSNGWNMHAYRRCVTAPLVWKLTWSGFACASVSAFKVTRRGTHYKFLLVWTLWYVGHVVTFISVDTLCGFNVPGCHKFSEMRDFCLFDLWFRNVQ